MIMQLTTPSFPNYFMELPDLTHSDKDSIITIDLFDIKLQNNLIFKESSTPKPSLEASAPVTYNSRFPNAGNKSITFLSRNQKAFNDLYYVHYITDQSTIQGVSVQYDCAVSSIRKVNELNSILNLDDVRIRKLLLIPLKCCGERFHSKKIYNPPRPSESIFNTNQVDVEEFIKESFSYDQNFHCDSGERDYFSVPGSVISRSIRRDVKKEFKLEEQTLELEGFTFIDNDTVPSFIVRIPSDVLKVRRRRHSTPLKNDNTTTGFTVMDQRPTIKRKRSTHSHKEPWMHRLLRFLGWDSNDCPHEFELDHL